LVLKKEKEWCKTSLSQSKYDASSFVRVVVSEDLFYIIVSYTIVDYSGKMDIEHLLSVTEAERLTPSLNDRPLIVR
jgi:hypothetical protein